MSSGGLRTAVSEYRLTVGSLHTIAWALTLEPILTTNAPACDRCAQRRILVFTEGQATEPIYVTHLHRDHRERVAVILDDRHGAPLTLVKLAVEALADARRDARRARGTAFDEVWCVFDVDEHPDLAEDSWERRV